MLATIAGILILNFLGLIIMLIIIGAAAGSETPVVEENSVLLAKFDTPIIDRTSDNPFNILKSMDYQMDGTMGLDQIIKDLKKAKTDDNIKGIVMRLSAIPTGMGILEEVRDALVDFKESGKFIIAHADTYTQKAYYLASAADKVYLTPTGDFNFYGLSAEVMYFKRALDKIGVDMQVVRHGSYKSAVEPFLTDKMSDENHEQLSEMVGTIWDKMLTEISAARNIPVDDLNRYADGLEVSFDDQAVEKGMIDGLKYYDELIDELKTLTDTDEDDDIPAITLKKYADVPSGEKKEASRNRIAVIYAMGSVVTGDAGEGMIGSERIAKAIRKARKDDKVKAIVFRVNSGGGSALASEIIYREVSLASETKPVVASMGDYAASGGYYILCAADTIVASETTLTGSIGVFGVLPNFQEVLNDKIGITTGVVKTNTHSDLRSPTRPLTAEERNMVQMYVDDTYTTFVNHVSEGRHMSFDEVNAIGGGHVWTGASAKDIGLIDVFGGLEKAIDLAAEMAGVENYRISSLPVLEDPFTVIMKELTGGVKMKIMKKELGESYEVYKKLEEIRSMKGIQAVMPYTIDFY